MLKYIISFADRLDVIWNIEIDAPDYTGTSIQLQAGGTPLVIEYNGNDDDDIFKKHVIPSSITMQVVSTGLEIDELMYISDASYKCRVYRESMLYWQGYVVSDGIQEIDSGVPYDVTIKAIDGLEVLENTVLLWDNYRSVIVGGEPSDLRAPINAIRVALFSSRSLDNKLPIRWNSSYKNDKYPTSDMLAGLTVINPRGDLSRAEKSPYWWLDNIAKSARSWVYQSGGKWHINDYFNSVVGSFNGYEIDTVTSSDTVAVTMDDDVINYLSPTDTVNQNWFWFGKKPYGSVSTIYKDTKFPSNNIIPNGEFNLVATGNLMYWKKTSGVNFIEQDDTIDNRDDSMSMKVTSGTGGYVYCDGTPIDSKVLFKDCKIGFLWLPISGYDVIEGSDYVDFKKEPLHVKVSYEIGTDTFYLNEFGYWAKENPPANMQVTSINNSNANNWVIIGFNPNRDAYIYDKFVMQITRPNGEFVEDYIDIIPETGTLNAGLNYIAAGLQAKGYSVDRASADSFTLNGYRAAGAYTVKAEGYYQKIQFDLGELVQQGTDVVSVEFRSRGSSGDVKIPSGMGKMKVEIYSKSGSVMNIGSVYFTVQDNSDVYEVYDVNSKNSKAVYDMGISSGYSGNMVSSYGNSYDTVNESMNWNNGKTLTELYSNSVMQVRNKPIRVFSGSIDKIMNFGLFSLMGKTYSPLSMSIDIKDNITNVVGAEFTPTTSLWQTTHKSSSD